MDKQLENKLSSREVSDMMEIRHDSLLRKIDGINKDFTAHKIVVSKYWVETSSPDNSGKQSREFLITKRGCEFLAHKTTGTKGNLFTDKYMDRFAEMENVMRSECTNQDLLLQFLSQLPQEQIQKLINTLHHKLLPVKSGKDILYDFLATDISILHFNCEGYPVIDADLFFEFIEKNGADKFNVLSELKNLDLVEINWCGKCVLTEFWNKYRSVIVVKMHADLKLYESKE